MKEMFDIMIPPEPQTLAEDKMPDISKPFVPFQQDPSDDDEDDEEEPLIVVLKSVVHEANDVYRSILQSDGSNVRASVSSEGENGLITAHFPDYDVDYHTAMPNVLLSLDLKHIVRPTAPALVSKKRGRTPKPTTEKKQKIEKKLKHVEVEKV